MPDKAWKQFERRVASFFHGTRVPLSGMAQNYGTKADVEHPAYFIECKHYAKHAAIRHWDKAGVQARREDKIPVIALGEKNRPGFWILIHSDDLDDFRKGGA